MKFHVAWEQRTCFFSLSALFSQRGGYRSDEVSTFDEKYIVLVFKAGKLNNTFMKNLNFKKLIKNLNFR